MTGLWIGLGVLAAVWAGFRWQEESARLDAMIATALDDLAEGGDEYE